MAQSLAADAMQYAGKGYVFGGAPANGLGDWDCSSFVNWCWGHDLGGAIPGYSAGTYDGKSHGPAVINWATWSGAKTIHGPPQSSDLCIWAGIGALGHMGIATDGQHMISALNHIQGTVHTPIAGFGPAGVPVIYRRITGAATGGGGIGGSLLGGCTPMIYYAWLIHNRRIARREFRRR